MAAQRDALEQVFGSLEDQPSNRDAKVQVAIAFALREIARELALIRKSVEGNA
jgi:hypothetical protein